MGDCLKKKSRVCKVQTFVYEYEYDDQGRLKKEYEPYKNDSSPGDYTEYTYDDYGRVTDKENPKGDVTIIYDGLTTTTTTPSNWQEKTIDAYGLTTEVSDSGGTITYTYNNMGLPTTINYGSYQVSLSYDDAGNRTRIDDPNAGVDSSVYNAWGELISYTDARGNTVTMDYDAWGRITSRSCGNDQTMMSYNSSTGMVDSITGSDATIVYTYDHLMRVTSEIRTTGSESLVTRVSYNSSGDPDSITYPGGFTQVNEYDANGFLSKIQRAGAATSIWELTSTNNLGQITGYAYGNDLNTTLGYDSNDRLQSIKASTIGNIDVFSREYSFNSKGNPTYRKNVLTGQQEDFTFDSLNRLVNYYDGTMEYAGNGNITYKPNTGDYNYDASRPNAVDEITGDLGHNVPPDENISYTWFGKVDEITANNNDYRLAFTYGPGLRRIKMQTYEGGSLTRTKYYAGNYEKIVESNGDTTEYTYIGSINGLVAVNIRRSGESDSLFYIHTDYLGSVMALTDASGAIREEYSYDAWGRRRDPDDWGEADTRTDLLIDRGYTGHEHLAYFSLINMNGRVYDPATGSMLSPDPIINPGMTQGLNRYSYVMNNPLKYTDPTGFYLMHNIYGNGYDIDVSNISTVRAYMASDGHGGSSGGGGGGGGTGYKYIEGPNDESYYTTESGQKVSWSRVYWDYIIPNGEQVTSESEMFSLLGYETKKVGGRSGSKIYPWAYGNKFYKERPIVLIPRPNIRKVNFLASDVEYQLAVAFAYVRYYGRDEYINMDELFDYNSLNKATVQYGGSSWAMVRSGHTRNIEYLFTLHGINETVYAQNVKFFSPGQLRDGMTSIYDPNVNENWFSSPNGDVSPFGLRMVGYNQYQHPENIITIFFPNYKILMKWVNFIKYPSSGF